MPAEDYAGSAASADRRCVWVLYDAATFEGIDLNTETWLDRDAATHRVPDMLTTERLAAIAELEQMASTLPSGTEMVRRSRLYLALADIDEPAHPVP